MVHEFIHYIRKPFLVGADISLSLEELDKNRLRDLFLPLRYLMEGLVDLSRGKTWDLDLVLAQEFIEFLNPYC